jgi:crotonobetainyl-CoA:carnitine CoA-transferase CaiB-like acyl-CoA transferase
MKPMLSGVRVVDLGAEVIKIEPLKIGDRPRLLGPPLVAGESGYFLAINRNKKSVALDLRKEEGRRVLYDLVRAAAPLQGGGTLWPH